VPYQLCPQVDRGVSEEEAVAAIARQAMQDSVVAGDLADVLGRQHVVGLPNDLIEALRVVLQSIPHHVRRDGHPVVPNAEKRGQLLGERLVIARILVLKGEGLDLLSESVQGRCDQRRVHAPEEHAHTFRARCLVGNRGHESVMQGFHHLVFVVVVNLGESVAPGVRAGQRAAFQRPGPPLDHLPRSERVHTAVGRAVVGQELVAQQEVLQ